MHTVSLDKVYAPPADIPVLLVIDVRVALFVLLNDFVAMGGTPEIGELLWSNYINNCPAMINPKLAKKADVYIVCADDWRSGVNYNYWRESWLRENNPAFAEYKGNRGTTSEDTRPAGYKDLLQSFRDYAAKENISVFRQEGFEADDFAGSFFRLANGNWQTILVSIDNDWGQLICDSKNILQYINGTFRVPISRLRGPHEIRRYYAERHDYLIDSTYDIVDFKVEHGDAGDNIEEGSPREIIDLRNPPIQPDELDLSKIFTWKPSNVAAMKTQLQLQPHRVQVVLAD